MHALGVPTSRSLTLYMSPTETVDRPWYTENSNAINPDAMVSNPVAITTRVAPSFLRVGQLELFARRARNEAHPNALNELKMIVEHLIERNYRSEIDSTLPFSEQVLEVARLFRARLISLVANWVRVGYCQGNFNSDNCAAGATPGLWHPSDSVSSSTLSFNRGRAVATTSLFSISRRRPQPISRCSGPHCDHCSQTIPKP